MANDSGLTALLDGHEAELLAAWTTQLKESSAGGGRMKDAELQTQSRNFLTALRQALATDGPNDIEAASFAPVKALLNEVSRSRAVQGFTPSETATFVFSLKKPLFELVQRVNQGDPQRIIAEIGGLSLLLDRSASAPPKSTRRAARR